jgi:hypothetical protein
MKYVPTVTGILVPNQLANVFLGCTSQRQSACFILATNLVRLMSDYEVTLVNDNSESNFPRAVLASCLTDRLQCKRIESNETPSPDLPAHTSQQAGVLHQVQGPNRESVNREKDEHWRDVNAHTGMYSSI